MNAHNLAEAGSLLQGGLRGSSDGAQGPQNDQARYLQDSCNSVKRSGFHMQQAIVRPAYAMQHTTAKSPDMWGGGDLSETQAMEGVVKAS